LLTVTSGLGLLAGNLLVGWVRRQVEQKFVPTFGVGAVIATTLVVIFFFGFRHHEGGVSLDDSGAKKSESDC
jgi:hypothetical protein